MNMMPMQNMQQPPVGHPAQPFVPLVMPAPTLTQHAQESQQSELLNYLQKRSVDLPPDVQQRIQSESRKLGKRVIKDLQAAAKSLGDARTTYEEAIVARTQHISTWKSFLAEAVKNWTEYARMFEEHEQALQARISQARDQFQEAKECLEASKTSAGNVVTEISDDEDLPAEMEVSTSAMQITESMRTLSSSLQKLSKDAEAIQVEGPMAKRPRIEEVPGGEAGKEESFN